MEFYNLETLYSIMSLNAGCLDLRNTGITSLPDNLTVGGWLDLRSTGITSLPDNLTVGGGVDLSNTGITSLPDNLTVGGWLDLSNTGITSLPDNLTVGGGVDLSNTGITSLPDNLTVGGGLDLRNTGITSLPDNLTVGGGLDLSNTGITSLPDNLTVGGSLDLRNTGITSLPDNLTVGGYLALRNTGIASLPNNLTVGGGLDLSNTGIEYQNYVKLKDGDYKENCYLYADGILRHVKKAIQKGKYTFYVGKIKDNHVVSDGTYYAHCKSFREGVEDILFKQAEARDCEQYRELALESVILRDEAINMYRIITGACRQGTEDFVKNLSKDKTEYSIQEIIALTQGQYGGSVFERFFDR